ncbi:MAG: hypothetical protein WC101_02935 [Candidatus Gracilibacteria bacterium]
MKNFLRAIIISITSVALIVPPAFAVETSKAIKWPTTQQIVNYTKTFSNNGSNFKNLTFKYPVNSIYVEEEIGDTKRLIIRKGEVGAIIIVPKKDAFAPLDYWGGGYCIDEEDLFEACLIETLGHIMNFNYPKDQYFVGKGDHEYQVSFYYGDIKTKTLLKKIARSIKVSN